MSPPRGRPPGLVTDLPAPAGHAFHAEVRIGWLLRCWRLAFHSGAAGDFVGRLNSGGVPADTSRLSRWETGRLPVPLEVIEAYERLLDRPRGGLLGIASLLRRLASGSPVPSVLYAGARNSPDALERLLDRALDGEPSGKDWFDLAICVNAARDRLVLPRSVWAQLTRRLVTETSLGIDNAYLSREEAAILLANHPSGCRALVYAVGEKVTAPDAMLVTDPMSLLQEVPGAQSNDLVLRLLDDEPRVTRNAAAWASAAKLARGHFSAVEVTRLEHILVRQVRADGLRGEASVGRLADLVAVMPVAARERIRNAARVPPASRARVADPGVLAAPEGAVRLARSLGADLDPLLAAVAVEALAHPGAERRFAAALLLNFSPFAPSVAGGCARWLAREVVGRPMPEDAELTHRVLVLFSLTAGDAEAALLLRLLEEGPAALRPMVLSALAHLPHPPLTPAELVPLVLGPDDPVARAALYYAGMNATPVLGSVLGELAYAGDVPAWRVRAAAWWRLQGPAIREPASGAPGSPAADPGTPRP